MKDVEIIGVLKSYINATLAGMGALKGASCQIQSITDGTDDHTIVFKWEDNDGVEHTSTMVVKDGDKGDTGATGNGIASIVKTSSVGLVDTYTITMTNGTTATFTVTNGEVTVFEGATSEANGAKGAVPAPLIADREKLLCGDGTWTDNVITEAQWTAILSALS